MSVKNEKKTTVAKLSSKHFITANNELRGLNLWFRAKTKAYLKPELKMKVVWNTFHKDLIGEMKSVSLN